MGLGHVAIILFAISVSMITIPAYAASNIVILEVEPNPAGTDAGNEWVRLFNPSGSSVNLSGWEIVSTHGAINSYFLSGNIPACNDIKIIFPSQFIDNEDESLILYDNTGRVVNSTPTIYDTSNDGSTWKITTPSCDSSQPEPEATPEPTPEPEPEYLPNGCPVGYPYIWSDGLCYVVSEPNCSADYPYSWSDGFCYKSPEYLDNGCHSDFPYLWSDGYCYTIPQSTYDEQVDSAPRCDPSYPTVCIPPYPPDLDCDEIYYSNFRVVGNDPHGFDRDNDGIGCEVGSPPSSNCDPSYPDVCIPPYPPDLNCGEIGYSNFRVVGNDPHGFDRDNDGIGCES
ncbi:MAG: lamin tail domain-containing protein [Thaumarchaeota archaeon]|nr:lamin tail domain-containing protein [Nitrososphaerota archaeon]